MGDFFVTITDPERAREFQEVLGTTTVPVKSLQPYLGSAPGQEGKIFYILDPGQLTDDQYLKLVRHLSKKFGLHPNQVREEMGKYGVPILAEHCSIVIMNPQRWI